MSVTGTLVSRKSDPVSVDGITLYCDGFKASGMKSFSEDVAASGKCVITNSGVRSARLTLTGRIFYEETPMELVVKADALLRKSSGFAVRLHGAVYSGCLLQSYSLEDCGEECMKASLTVITGSPVTGG